VFHKSQGFTFEKTAQASFIVVINFNVFMALLKSKDIKNIEDDDDDETPKLFIFIMQ